MSNLIIKIKSVNTVSKASVIFKQLVKLGMSLPEIIDLVNCLDNNGRAELLKQIPEKKQEKWIKQFSKCFDIDVLAADETSSLARRINKIFE